ncbi:MAG: molybdopterin-guanine dinucleotide biosynthesis protein B [Gammaproteobacteria bacterium]|nr:molybdopterin-guanine dinucleotide biosynthesis protein B [Gammaproteobacteria bacterium]
MNDPRRAAASVPVLGFAAWSGTGKTTLLIRLLPLLKARGIRVGVVKHAHHDFDLDYPGKDSYELRKAGAAQMLVGSRRRWALIVERESSDEPRLADLMQHLLPADIDLILVEGFKPETIPKIEIHRPSLGKPVLAVSDTSVIAIATDAPLTVPGGLPLLDLNDPAQVVEFIVSRFVPAADTRAAPAPRV